MNLSINLRPGEIVQSSRWLEPLHIDLIEFVGEDYVRIVGALIKSREHIDDLVPLREITQLKPPSQQRYFSSSPLDVFLALEAKRYRYASQYDPLLAMNISKVDPLPHQIEAVYGYILHQPRIRFLIADDPGAGKTIMAGLVIKEMKLRDLVRRILIVVPGHLKDQWQRELKERFEEPFIVIDRQTMRNYFGENVWEKEYQIITSLDFARQDDVMNVLAGIQWDFVVVDEAHKMAAYRYGEKTEKTKRYRLGELLSRNSVHLLFLTATPHRGDPENFRLFLDLLQPGSFATTEMLDESLRNRDNPLFIRRLKEDLKDFEGKPLFLPRKVKTLTFDLGVESVLEKELYNSLSRYVIDQYNKALASEKRRNISFALVILQRRLASSTYALYRSLERRKRRLEEMRDKADAFTSRQVEPTIPILSMDDVEEMSEKERWEQEQIWETLSMAENRAELDEEIHTLENLLKQAKKIIEQGEEVKLRHFQNALEELKSSHPDEKILIFTESRDTLDYLERRLRNWGYSVCTIHGGMSLETRLEAEKIFKNEAQIMVATEAAGEGINLQFCHLMINYDIPWNPNRLEQRMGRIHRYGQTREVAIFNLVAADTREGKVLARLFQRLDEISRRIGSDKVFDVIDEVFPGRNLAQLLTEAAANARTMDDILQELEIHVDEEYISKIKDSLGESLATRHIDYTRMGEMNERAREQRLIPEYTQAFFQKAWARLEGDMHPHKSAERHGFFVIGNVPPAISKIADQTSFKKRYGSLQRRYPLATFDKDLAMKESEAEFISFGHPVFEAVLQWAEQDLQNNLLQGAVFLDPDGQRDGVMLFYEAQINDGMGDIAGKRLFALFFPRNGGEIEAISPASIWDLAQTDSAIEENIDIDQLQKQSVKWIIPQLEKYKEELLSERRRQIEIKRKYGLESLRYLILELDNDLIRLQNRKDAGEDVSLAIYNKKQQKDAYLEEKKRLEERLQREVQMTLAMPRYLSALRVIPLVSPQISDGMANDPEIERLGMETVFRYEKEHGRQPQDVSLENFGYDIRSFDPQERKNRYIEVKARAGIGSVALTQNEWFTAQRFDNDYYLYVVMNATSETPSLFILQNPARRLQPKEQLKVRYLITADIIKQIAYKAN